MYQFSILSTGFGKNELRVVLNNAIYKGTR